MKHLIIRAERQSYDAGEVRGMTAGELIKALGQFDPDAVVALNDGGGMYSGISETIRIDWEEREAFTEVDR